MRYKLFGAAVLGAASLFAQDTDYNSPVNSKLVRAEQFRHVLSEATKRYSRPTTVVKGVDLGEFAERGNFTVRLRGRLGAQMGSRCSYILECTSFDNMKEVEVVIGGSDDSIDFLEKGVRAAAAERETEVPERADTEFLANRFSGGQSPDWANDQANEIIMFKVKLEKPRDSCFVEVPATVKKSSKIKFAVFAEMDEIGKIVSVAGESKVLDRRSLGIDIDAMEASMPYALTNGKGKAIVKEFSWSPDSKQIAYATMYPERFSKGRGAINLYNLSITDLKGNKKQFEGDIFFRDSFSEGAAITYADFVWSPDGNIYITDRNGLWKVNPETENRERLEDTGGIEFGLSVSKTGRLAFMSKNKGFNLFTLDNGKSKKIKTYQPLEAGTEPFITGSYSIKWLPDNKRLAINYWKGGGMAMDIVDTETLDVKTIDLPKPINSFDMMCRGNFALATLMSIGSNSRILKISAHSGKVAEFLKEECYALDANPVYPVYSALLVDSDVKMGRNLYLIDANGDSSIIKRDTEEPRGRAVYQKWSPDGKRLGIILRAAQKEPEELDLFWINFNMRGKKSG